MLAMSSHSSHHETLLVPLLLPRVTYRISCYLAPASVPCRASTIYHAPIPLTVSRTRSSISIVHPTLTFARSPAAPLVATQTQLLVLVLMLGTPLLNALSILGTELFIW